jgi:hypothetical protein
VEDFACRRDIGAARNRGEKAYKLFAITGGFSVNSM